MVGNAIIRGVPALGLPKINNCDCFILRSALSIAAKVDAGKDRQTTLFDQSIEPVQGLRHIIITWDIDKSIIHSIRLLVC